MRWLQWLALHFMQTFSKEYLLGLSFWTANAIAQASSPPEAAVGSPTEAAPAKRLLEQRPQEPGGPSELYEVHVGSLTTGEVGW